MRLLILGGTAEASALVTAIAGRADIEATLSLAGRTQRPAPSPVPTRIGGFGGVEGLRAYLGAEGVDAIIDATHPFAAQMSRHAAQACEAAKRSAARLHAPAMERGRTAIAGSRSTTMEDAARALGATPAQCVPDAGRLQLAAFANAPQHRYLVRAIERPAEIDALPSHRLILSRGPFRLIDEEALMREENIEIVVSKNSGGDATYAKIGAARNLGLPVVMVRRPAKPDIAPTTRLEEVLAWIDSHRAAP